MRKPTSDSQSGTSLIETIIAMFICTIVVFSLAGLVSMATKQSKEMGTTAAQAAALAAQQLDIFMVVEFTDSEISCTTLPCGSLTTDTTTSGVSYFDYLKVDGTATTSTAADRFFVRRWEVSAPTGLPAGLKLIRVRVERTGTVTGVSPESIVGAYKSDEQSPTPTV